MNYRASHETQWKILQEQLDPSLNSLLLVAGIVNILAALILFLDGSNLLFAYVGLIVGTVLFILRVFRNKVSVQTKTIIILIIIAVHAALSFYNSGLIGTAVLVLLLVQVVALVFLRLRVALFVAMGTVFIYSIYMVLAHLDVIYWDASLLARMNNLAHWVTTLIGVFLFFIVSAYTITYLKRSLLENVSVLERMAYYDEMTSLPRRSRFEDLVNQRISSGVTSGYLVMMNLRNFRVFNSLYGSEYGDKIIEAIGVVLQKYQGEQSIMSRLSGDEFAAWFEGWDEEILNTRVEEFRQELDSCLGDAYRDTVIEFYLSASSFPYDGACASECIRASEMALKEAKEQASLKVVRFHPSMLENAEQEMKLRRLLEVAVKEKSFHVHYQNKVNIHTGTVVGVEALARWYTEEMGNINPEVFIPILGKSPLMIPFGQIVFETVLSHIPRLREKHGEHITVSINTSPLFFLKPGFAEYIIDKISRADVDPSMITLEITEDVFIEDIEHIQVIIRELRAAGVNISLDDFGKGYSSLYYISHIDFNELKVDKSFIDDICRDNKSFNLFESICHIAASLGYKVVAEGVETRMQIEKIMGTSCDVVQGFYYSHPEPL